MLSDQNAGSRRRLLRLRLLAELTLALTAGACNASGSGQVPNATEEPGGAPTATAIRLSADAQAEPAISRCLANDLGVVTRYNDNEAYLAVDPRNLDHVLAIWQTQSGSGSVVQSVRSTDGGKSWTPPRAVPINACAGGPVAGAARASDPWVTFGPDGRAYLSAIAFQPNPNDGVDLTSTLVVVASPDGGVTWDAPVVAAAAPSSSISHDNLATTADPTRPRTIYIATTRAEYGPGSSDYYGRLGFARSDDAGKTWTPMRPITAAVNGERIGAPQIVVDPRSGKLYAVYHRSRQGTSVIGVMASTDRGDSWSAEAAAAPSVRSARPNHPTTGRSFELATDIVQAVVSPTTGQLIIAYADARRAPGGRGDVSLVWSADGKTWSSPMTLSESSAETAWLPAIAAGADGELAVSYLSANFSAGSSSDPRVRLIVHRLRAGPGGLTPIDRVVLDDAALQWPGDYQGLVAVRRGYLAAVGRESDAAAVAIAPH